MRETTTTKADRTANRQADEKGFEVLSASSPDRDMSRGLREERVY
jgi:hypothetical protein